MLRVEKVQLLKACTEGPRWLIEQLWAEEAVGIIGGEPKCCKSFLALDAAVAVAAGGLCLGRFAVTQAGPVLLFAAEDALQVVRQRVEGIARARQLDFDKLDIRVITEPSLRLDRLSQRQALHDTVAACQPRLLVLDPFVRLHRIDENAVAEVAPLLACLRELQRQFHTGVMLVHHARKGAAHVRAGQALRGSSELHAWGDSNLYLRRRAETLQLTIEHRAAAAPPPLTLQLSATPEQVALQLAQAVASGDPVSTAPGQPLSPIERIRTVLRQAQQPMTQRQLRLACQMRTATLCDALSQLQRQGELLRNSNGYRLRTPPHSQTESLTAGEPQDLRGG